jgi:molecular chaperone DnaK
VDTGSGDDAGGTDEGFFVSFDFTGDALTEIRGKIESALNSLKEVAKGDDGEAIKRAMENLGQASQELGKILYEEAAQKQAAAGGKPGEPEPKHEDPAEGEVRRKGGDDVIDAEFEAK